MKSLAIKKASAPATFVSLAGAASPGMAVALEKLVRAHLRGERADLSVADQSYIRVAGAALAVVNRTPGCARQIGHDAANAVWVNPVAAQLAEGAMRALQGAGLTEPKQIEAHAQFIRHRHKSANVARRRAA
jgi:hypothetical protein